MGRAERGRAERGLRIASVGPIEGGPSELGDAISAALADLDDGGKLVLVYLPALPRAELRAFLAAAGRAAPGLPLMGATTGGSAFTERGITRTGVVAAVLGGDASVRTADALDLRSTGERSIRQAIDSLEVEQAHSPSVLVFMDAYATDGEALATALREHVPLGCRCFGGTAGDSWQFRRRTYVFHDGEVLSNAAVFALIETPTKLAVDVLHGLATAQVGREMVITEIEGRVLRKLDGRPAATVYVDELRHLDLLCPSEDLISSLFRSEIGVTTPFGERLKIRAPLGIDADGSITLSAGLRRGQVVRVVTPTPDALVKGASELATRVRTQVGASLRGALVFDCALRLKVLAERARYETSVFSGDARCPTLGFSSYGEIAKFGGSAEAFHNITAVMVGW